ncbi:hypothetical protein BpHYR1_018930 [Brachionus plicatilis]|uniref:Uncharacterized protein n=1 Tax=Brachionus plicatilis TaxID=10195 RepID=A0A3M7S7A4_BRAPC|nr:hypothetical protein BpHYR1_018930 [Brachionus plicatilis]
MTQVAQHVRAELCAHLYRPQGRLDNLMVLPALLDHATLHSLPQVARLLFVIVGFPAGLSPIVDPLYQFFLCPRLLLTPTACFQFRQFGSEPQDSPVPVRDLPSLCSIRRKFSRPQSSHRSIQSVDADGAKTYRLVLVPTS